MKNLKTIILVVIVAMFTMTSCKKDNIDPNVPETDIVDNNPDIEEGEEENVPHISDSMQFVSISFSTNKTFGRGIVVSNGGQSESVYTNSPDSSLYVSNGWSSGLGNWSGYVKPGSSVELSGTVTAAAQVQNFETRIGNGDWYSVKIHTPDYQLSAYYSHTVDF